VDPAGRGALIARSLFFVVALLLAAAPAGAAATAATRSVYRLSYASTSHTDLRELFGQPAGAETAGRLERKLEGALGMRVPVMAVSRGTLPRFEMKAKRWVVKKAE